MVLTRKKLSSWILMYLLASVAVFLVLFFADRNAALNSQTEMLERLDSGIELMFGPAKINNPESLEVIANRLFSQLAASGRLWAFEIADQDTILFSWQRSSGSQARTWPNDFMWYSSSHDRAALRIRLCSQLADPWKYPGLLMGSAIILVIALLAMYGLTARMSPEAPGTTRLPPSGPEVMVPVGAPDEQHALSPPVPAECAPPSAEGMPHQTHDELLDLADGSDLDVVTAAKLTEEIFFEQEPQSFIATGNSLLDSESGVSNGANFAYRLKKELERASENAQDLSLAFLEFEPSTETVLHWGVKLLLEEFIHEDLIFRMDKTVFALILPQLGFDQSIAHLEMMYRKLERLQETGASHLEKMSIMSGLSSRNGRLVAPERLIEEAQTALSKTDRKKGRIVGFRPDPTKFRNFLKHTKI